ncbi:MAG: glutamine-hydrolyzing carbamoyl-phosphate synthase small subunit [Leptonema sp. (in: bacteria)]
MFKENKKKAVLVLENGDFYIGNFFGYPKKALGEVCFNTSMTGYQEILTDPSYYGQIVVMTYPSIGNYGINLAYSQSDKIQCKGFVVKKYIKKPSNFFSQKTLEEFLIENQTPAIEDIDTRKLVLTLRNQGVMRGGIFPEESGLKSFMLDEVFNIPPMVGLDLTSFVTTKQPYRFSKGEKSLKIAVLDFGVKKNILNYLDEVGFDVYVFPSFTSWEAIQHFDCYFLSNGPGDPAATQYAIETVKEILKLKKPIFGICLGHQILGLAKGWETYKLKFGHRGGNQPVLDVKTKKVEITAQNHGFAVEAKDQKDLNIIYINLNDHTIEGFEEKNFPILSVQHHPEASPGPNDAKHIFKDFYILVKNFYKK